MEAKNAPPSVPPCLKFTSRVDRFWTLHPTHGVGRKSREIRIRQKEPIFFDYYMPCSPLSAAWRILWVNSRFPEFQKSSLCSRCMGRHPVEKTKGLTTMGMNHPLANPISIRTCVNFQHEISGFIFVHSSPAHFPLGSVAGDLRDGHGPL